MIPPFWLRTDKISRTITAALAVVGLLAIVVVAIGIKASAENRSQKQIRDSADVQNIKQTKNASALVEKEKRYEGSAVISEWQAFVVYHPSSEITEDSLFLDSKYRPSGGDSSDKTKAGTDHPQGIVQVLGARSLLPILRMAFGDQARGAAAAERDPWFFTHPTSFFNPQQTKSLCGRDIDIEADEGSDICWKPKLTNEYLETLTDFAGDACPQLVLKESKQDNRFMNKLMRSSTFSPQALRHFAIQALHIPQDRASDEWINHIMSESKRSIEAELESQNQEASAEELYALACQEMLLSKEFYSR